jgi:hypothetical protein
LGTQNSSHSATANFLLDPVAAYYEFIQDGEIVAHMKISTSHSAVPYFATARVMIKTSRANTGTRQVSMGRIITRFLRTTGSLAVQVMLARAGLHERTRTLFFWTRPLSGQMVWEDLAQLLGGEKLGRALAELRGAELVEAGVEMGGGGASL